jgi:hypothetical protein
MTEVAASPPPITCSKDARWRDSVAPPAVALAWPAGSICPGVRVWPEELVCGALAEASTSGRRVRNIMRMSRYCSRVSTAAVADRRAPVARGKRAACRGDRRRACQRHRVSKRDHRA